MPVDPVCGESNLASDCAFVLDASEICFFNSVNDEITHIVGGGGLITDENGVVQDGNVAWYQLSKYENRDPLYQEASTTESFRGPYYLLMTVVFDEGDGNYSQDAQEEGIEREYDATVTVTRNEWREKIVNSLTPGFAEPVEGDVALLWNSRAFDVLKVDRTAYIAATGQYIGWKISLKARDSFEPTRRLETP